MKVPCGKCLSCRIAKQKEWATRIIHEKNYHSDSMFLCLTYDDEHLPIYGSLVKKDLQKWFKRLRKKWKNKKIKYLACGEYGEEEYRPHYHVILFGLGAQHLDTRVYNCGHIIYYDDTWPMGHIHAGSVSYNSARYVIKYIHKKHDKNQYIRKIIADYGTYWLHLQKPFQLQSQGLGLQFILDNQKQIIENMKITINGVPVMLPRYYMKKLELSSSKLLQMSNEYKIKQYKKLIKRGIKDYRHSHKIREENYNAYKLLVKKERIFKK